MKRRAICKNYNKTGAMKIGSDGKPIRYSSLRPILALNILCYDHFDDEDALRILELYDPIRKKRLNKKLIQIGFLELSKGVSGLTPNQKYWHDYFTIGEVGSEAPAYIQKASQIINYVNLSEEERNVITTLERLEANEQAVREYAYMNGQEKGRSIRDTEIAINLFKLGMKIQDISIATGLDIPTLQKLQSEIT